jgi:energy-coupling factor transporter ATP-binding protein EcfA2
MELESLRVRKYRCIDDSGWVAVDNLTCLVGKNESGKTAFMEAVERLNPSFDRGEYEPYQDYPRPEWPAYSNRHEEDPDVVASARFELAESEVKAVEDAFAPGLLAEPTVTVHRDYTNERRWGLEFDESVLVEYILDEHDVPEGAADRLAETDSLSAIQERSSGGTEDPLSILEYELGGPPVAAVADEVGATVLSEHLPEFRYIGEYSIMDGTIEVGKFVERQENDELTPGDYVFLSLLSVAGLELSDLQKGGDWRQTRTELETASASISDRAMRYWSQSGDLQIRIQSATSDDDDRQVLDLRVENREHNVTVEFEQRSRGFRWFFSAFCQLSELEQSDSDLVLMLDEPGLNLHAHAKQEFLSFLKTELAPRHPIVYTTHSPFMIDQENLHRTKLVMADPVGEHNVVSDVADADDYTRFPLRNVFEVDLMDTLLVRPQTLLVERKADHVYLYVVSKLFRDLDERGLDNRWTVVPIKDAENMGTFVSLFGAGQLDAAALLNDDPGERRSGQGETAAETSEVPVTLLPEYTASGGESTIEDIFSESFYLEVVNRTYATAIGETDGVPDRLTTEELSRGDQPIVRDIESYFQQHDINGGVFDRDEVALCLQDNREEFEGELDKKSRRRFTRLFRDLNNTLESFEGVDPRRKSLLETLGFG